MLTSVHPIEGVMRCRRARRGVPAKLTSRPSLGNILVKACSENIWVGEPRMVLRMKPGLAPLYKRGFSNDTPAWHDLMGLMIIFALGALRWHHLLHAPAWAPDGYQYQSGIDLILMGRSPYEQSVFPYPPSVAVFGSWVTMLWGAETFRVLFRYVNLLGGCAALWGSLALIRARWLVKLAGAALSTLFLPAFVNGLENDNLSLLAGGTAIAALVWWPRFPIFMGFVLGFGLAFKPLALVALFVFAAHRNQGFIRAKWLTAVTACLTAGILLSFEPTWFITAPFQPSVKAAETDWASGVINVSLFRVLTCFGLKISPFMLLLVVTGISVAYAGTRPLNPAQLLCVACSSALLSLPIVWQHTLVLITPVAFTATALAFGRIHKLWNESKDREGRNGRRRELSCALLIAAGAETILEANAYGVIGNWNTLVNGMTLMIPIATLILLTGFIVKFEADAPIREGKDLGKPQSEEVERPSFSRR